MEPHWFQCGSGCGSSFLSQCETRSGSGFWVAKKCGSRRIRILVKILRHKRLKTLKNVPTVSVVDPNPHPDPYNFGPPGSASGSVSRKCGSGSEYLHHQAKLVRKTLISTVLWLIYEFLLLLRSRIRIRRFHGPESGSGWIRIYRSHKHVCGFVVLNPSINFSIP